jgi:hypothetical protein
MAYGAGTNLFGVRQYLQDFMASASHDNMVAVGPVEPQPIAMLSFSGEGGTTADEDTSYHCSLMGRQGNYSVYLVDFMRCDVWSGESYPPPLDACGGVNTGVGAWGPWNLPLPYPVPSGHYPVDCDLPGSLVCLSAGLCAGPAPAVYVIPYIWLLAVTPGWRKGKMWEPTTEYVCALWADQLSMSTGAPSPPWEAWGALTAQACAGQAPVKDPGMPNFSDPGAALPLWDPL